VAENVRSFHSCSPFARADHRPEFSDKPSIILEVDFKSMPFSKIHRLAIKDAMQTASKTASRQRNTLRESDFFFCFIELLYQNILQTFSAVAASVADQSAAAGLAVMGTIFTHKLTPLVSG